MKTLTITAFLTLCLLGSVSAQVPMNQLTQGLKYRNIGPANQGGRIVDIDAHNDDFKHVYIATASGGVWKSGNAGTTWEPIFDDYETASIGDIALDQKNKNNLWVGTGEANNRNSVSWGNGVYKSSNAGKTFVNKGLKSTHHISRVLVHPEDSDDVCACATGHLWGYSGERGIFNTTDGGDSWQQLKNGLPKDKKLGCTDLVRDSKNPDILYAAMYHRLRQPWHFHSGSDSGGIYKSIDGGKNWTKLSSGLPEGPTGRIGLAIYDKDPNILMAIIEAEKTGNLSEPGSGIYRSEDAGATWKYVNTYNNRPFYYSQIKINPNDDQRVYVMTTSFRVSTDGGNTFVNGSKDQEVHGDFHAIWNDPNDVDRYYLGADKGFSLTHDHGQHFTLIDNLPIAQFYRIGYDMRDPYYVYGGLQDNGSYATASFSRDARGILNDSNWKMHWGDGQNAIANPYDYTDMYSSMEKGSFFKYNPKNRDIKRISPTALNTTNYWDHFDKDEKDKRSASRWNWSAPMKMSHHDPHTIYVGGNHVFKTNDQGRSWKIISPDLSTNHPVKRKHGGSGGITADNTGAETHCAIHTLSESSIDADVIWIGTDDGNVQITRDGGDSWENVRSRMPKVPKELWVSRIEASHYEQGRAYVTFDGHRSDNFQPWVFVTEDYGRSWKMIIKGFSKDEVVRVIREDFRNPNLLFAGTETGVWMSINRGSTWSRLKLNMPTVSVYDLKIHPRDNDLIVGTHGRSLWILEDISPLQQLTPEIMAKDIHLFDQKPATLWKNVSRGGQRGHFLFMGDNPSAVEQVGTKPRANMRNNAMITYYVGRSGMDSLNLTVSNFNQMDKVEIKVPAHPGINRYFWNREFAAKAYSPSEEQEVLELLGRINDAYDNSRVRRGIKQFTEIDDPYTKRRVIEPLTRGYLSFDIDKRFLIQRAEEGSYQLSLSSGTKIEKSTLNVRKDPME